jgi:hypothetical protein
MVGQHLHDAGADVAVERVITGADNDALGVHALAADMLGLAHEDAQRLGLVAAGDDAAVVVGEHDNRPAAQLRLKQRFAGSVEVIAVDQPDRCSVRAVHTSEHAHRAGDDAPDFQRLAFGNLDRRKGRVFGFERRALAALLLEARNDKLSVDEDKHNIAVLGA